MTAAWFFGRSPNLSAAPYILHTVFACEVFTLAKEQENIKNNIWLWVVLGLS